MQDPSKRKQASSVDETSGKKTKQDGKKEASQALDKKEEKVTVRPNTDGTKGLPPPKRRLDSFADLLASRSQCVAVVVDDGRLFIAANELAVQEHKYIQASIWNVVTYLTSQSAHEEEQRKDMFRQICHYLRPILFKGAYLKQLEGFSIETVNKVFEYREKGKTFSDFMRDLRKHKNPESFPILCSKYDKLFTAFSKLEGIRSSEEDTAESAQDISNKNLLAALLNDPRLFVKSEKQPLNVKVHAEMQILAYIVNKIIPSYLAKPLEEREKREIYIGISKRCCLYCNTMLQAANKIFELYKIPITLKFRGSHNLDFGWNPPEMFADGYHGKEPPVEQLLTWKGLAHQIGQLGKRGADALLPLPKNEPGSLRSMEHEDSDSDPEPSTDTFCDTQLKELEGHVKFLKKWPSDSKESSKNSELDMRIAQTEIAISLFRIEAFKDLCSLLRLAGALQRGSTLATSFLNRFAKIQNACNKNLPTEKRLNLGRFLLILENPALVGKKVSQSFAALKPAIKLPSSKPTLSGSVGSRLGGDYVATGTELRMPDDNSCLFWSVALGILIPVLDDKDAYQRAFNQLFVTEGDSEDARLFGQHGDSLKARIKAFSASNDTSLIQKNERQGEADPLYRLINFYFRQKVANYIAVHTETYTQEMLVK